MTEDEAKTKWCPFARAGSGQSGLGSMNRDAFPGDHAKGLIEQHSRCIASACMAWRTIPPKSLALAKEYAEEKQWISAIKALREVCREMSLLEAKQIVQGDRPWPVDEWHGYCGLAGASQ